MSSADVHPTTRNAHVESRLSEIRRKRGVAAAGLARQAGVSRQTIYAMEAGDYVPNTAVALRLARILEVSVEELFCLDPQEPPPIRTLKVDVVGGQDVFPGTAVELCQVGGRLVAVPAVPAPWQLLPADGLLVNPGRSTVQMFEEHDAANRLLIAGCDPAASVLARHLARAGVHLVTAPVNSSEALDLLKKRMVHIAGTHLCGETPGDTPAVDRAFPKRSVALFAFAVWEQGLVLARGNPKMIRSVADLGRSGVRLVNREKGSGSRQLLDRQLKQCGVEAASILGYSGDSARGHLPAAWRVYSGLGDCCVATRSAARAFGLDFMPLTSERYDLVIRREHLELAAVERLLDLLTQASLRRELDALCGYNTRETGRRIA
jgi:putative molybdopterin biosynthesis protein